MAKPTEPGADRATILAELARVADALTATHTGEASLYAQRCGLFLAGRALTPPITYPALAVAAKVTEGAVTQVVRARQAKATT